MAPHKNFGLADEIKQLERLIYVPDYRIRIKESERYMTPIEQVLLEERARLERERRYIDIIRRLAQSAVPAA